MVCAVGGHSAADDPAALSAAGLDAPDVRLVVQSSRTVSLVRHSGKARLGPLFHQLTWVSICLLKFLYCLMKLLKEKGTKTGCEQNGLTVD